MKKIELIRNDITYIGVKNQVFNSLTLRQNLKVILGKEYDDNKIDELINKYDLTKYLDKKYKNLSMGEKGKIFLLIIPLIKKKPE
ncbi:MAG: ATP-binding cassette domain-containing protein [Clostridium sp.]|nr:MAG: ATP-binding cassette domain-containing protein [Clostridium sp.]